MNNGLTRPAWFNIRELPPCRTDFDENGIVASISAIESIIQAKIHQGTDSRNIVLAGFSQGATLALMVALTTLHDLGGVASLSGWIPQLIREVGYYAYRNLNLLTLILHSNSKWFILNLVFLSSGVTEMQTRRSQWRSQSRLWTF